MGAYKGFPYPPKSNHMHPALAHCCWYILLAACMMKLHAECFSDYGVLIFSGRRNCDRRINRVRSRQSNWQRVHCTGAAASCCGFPRLCQSSLRAVAALYYCLTLSLARLSGWLPRPAIVRLSNVQVHLSAVHPPVHLPHSLLLQVAPHGTVLQQLVIIKGCCLSYFSTGL